MTESITTGVGACCWRCGRVISIGEPAYYINHADCTTSPVCEKCLRDDEQIIGRVIGTVPDVPDVVSRKKVIDQIRGQIMHLRSQISALEELERVFEAEVY